MEQNKFKYKYFDLNHFNVTGLAADVWKVVVRFLTGFYDSLRVDHAIRQVQKDDRLKSVVISCFLLNILYIVIIMLLDWLLEGPLPWLLNYAAGDNMGLQSIATVVYYVLYIVAQLFWTLPMFITTLWRSMKWSNELAAILPPPMMPRTIDRTSQSEASFVSQISDTLVFAFQLVILKGLNSIFLMIPHTGYYLSAVLSSLLASYYAFDTHWYRIHPGQPSAAYIAWMERDWAYFLGFGVVLTVLSSPSSVAISLALYDAVLPIYVLIAARPEAAAWQRSHQKPKLEVFPQSIRYFGIGHKVADLISMGITYFAVSFQHR